MAQEEKRSCNFRTSIGGQALIEGILMRGPEKQAIVVRSPEGELSLDFKGKAPGRGAYLCGKPECLKKARKSRAIERALSVEVPDSVYDQLEQQMKQEGANGN